MIYGRPVLLATTFEYIRQTMREQIDVIAWYQDDHYQPKAFMG